MAIGDAYASAAEYRDRKRKQDTSPDATVLTQLTAVSRFLEREAGQFFNRDGAATARILFGDGSDVLFLKTEGLPGIATTTGLVVKVDTDDDGSFADETAVTGVVARPLNAALGPEAAPYTELWLPSGASRSYFPTGYRVEVTADYGWPEVPDLIKELCIELTAIWRQESQRATGRIPELSQVVSESPYALSLVKRFRNAYRMPVVA